MIKMGRNDPKRAICPISDPRRLGLTRSNFGNKSVSTIQTFLQVQRPAAANAARTFFWVKKSADVCQQRSPPPSSMPRHSAEPPWPQYESSTFAFYQTFSPQSGLFRQFSLNWKDKCTLFTFFNNIPMKTAFVIFDLNTFNFQTFYLVSQSYKALASERILYFISPIYLQFIVNYFLVI